MPRIFSRKIGYKSIKGIRIMQTGCPQGFKIQVKDLLRPDAIFNKFILKQFEDNAFSTAPHDCYYLDDRFIDKSADFFQIYVPFDHGKFMTYF